MEQLIDGGESATKEKKKTEPSISDYFMHFLSVPWKLLFATIPPTGLLRLGLGPIFYE